MYSDFSTSDIKSMSLKSPFYAWMYKKYSVDRQWCLESIHTLNKRVWIDSNLRVWIDSIRGYGSILRRHWQSTLYFFQLFPKQYDSLFDYLHKNCPYHKKCSATWCEDENVTNSKPHDPKMHSYESNETTRGGEK